MWYFWHVAFSIWHLRFGIEHLAHGFLVFEIWQPVSYTECVAASPHAFVSFSLFTLSPRMTVRAAANFAC
jgi:hypothetical protein